jgi:hypothetical protein
MQGYQSRGASSRSAPLQMVIITTVFSPKKPFSFFRPLTKLLHWLELIGWVSTTLDVQIFNLEAVQSLEGIYTQGIAGMPIRRYVSSNEG